MASKRSNKTARVLNLIATPNDTTSAEHEQPSASDTPAQSQTETVETSKEKAHSSTTKKKPSKTAAESPSEPTPESAAPAFTSEAPTTEQPQPQAPSAPMPQPVVPIVQTVREKEQQLSDDIKSGLLQALSEVEHPSQPAEAAHADEPQEPTVSAEIPESETVETRVPEPEVIAEPATEQEAAQAASEVSQPEKTALSADPTEPDLTGIKIPQPQTPSQEIYTPAGEQDVEYTNVLQELVENASSHYITNMLQCQCQRCIVDMKALALTNLPSKYVVLEKSKRAAYMSVYAARYEKELSIQMMRACVIVNEHPHH